MKCHQCENNAIYLVGPEQDLPLCLHCCSILEQIQQRKIQTLREEANYAADSINAIWGLPTVPRYPSKRTVIVSNPTTNNHITISNNQIGILNTGYIENLNQNIDTLYTSSAPEIADKLKGFVQEIINSKEFTQEQKNEILEHSDFLAQQALLPRVERKVSVAKTLITQLSNLVNFSASSLTLWQALQPLFQKLF